MRSGRIGQRLVYEDITLLWAVCAPLLLPATLFALASGLTWTNGLIIALALVIPFAVRRRVEFDRAYGRVLVAWVLSLSPRGPRLVLRELVHGRLSTYQDVQVVAVKVFVRGGSVTEHRVRLVGQGSERVALAVASEAQNAALAGVLDVLAMGDRRAALVAAGKLARDLGMPLRDSPSAAVPAEPHP